VETILLQVNEAKIRSYEDTPFLQESMSNIFGFHNETQATQEVLDGVFECPANATACTKDLLQHLQTAPIARDAEVLTPRKHISTDDNIKAWKRAKERTAAGISGLHFGMFKAHTHRRKLAALDASMRSIAYMTGFSYARWKKGVDVQLLKKKKDYRVEKLRTILLLKADFNMNNKALGNNDTMKTGRTTQDTHQRQLRRPKRPQSIGSRTQLMPHSRQHPRPSRASHHSIQRCKRMLR
jgi:hypothetical protein